MGVQDTQVLGSDKPQDSNHSYGNARSGALYLCDKRKICSYLNINYVHPTCDELGSWQRHTLCLCHKWNNKDNIKKKILIKNIKRKNKYFQEGTCFCECVNCVECHISRVTCHFFKIYFWFYKVVKLARQWRVCCQQGYPI